MSMLTSATLAVMNPNVEVAIGDGSSSLDDRVLVGGELRMTVDEVEVVDDHHRHCNNDDDEVGINAYDGIILNHHKRCSNLDDYENFATSDNTADCNHVKQYGYDSNSKSPSAGCGTSEMTPNCNNESRRAARKQARREKDRFFVFTRVLVKYLEQTDVVLHSEVREVIRDCTERKSRKESGYDCVVTVLKQRIKEIVNEETWHLAELYYERFLKEKAMIRSSSFKSRRGSMSSQQSRRGSMSSRHTVDTVETEDSTFSTSHASSPILHDPSETTICYWNNHNYTNSYPSLSHPHSSMGQQHHRQQRRASANAGSAAAAVAYEKERLVLLVRILLKVLQENDPEGLYIHTRDIVQDCIERHNRNEPGYESVASVVQERLDIVIPPEFWEQAHHLLLQERRYSQGIPKMSPEILGDTYDEEVLLPLTRHSERTWGGSRRSSI